MWVEVLIMILTLLPGVALFHSLPRLICSWNAPRWRADRARRELLSRLTFVMSLERNSGHWIGKGETRKRIEIRAGGPVFEVCKSVYRWQAVR